MSKHLIKSEFTASQMLSLIDSAGATITLALVSISTNPVLTALAEEANKENPDPKIAKTLTHQYDALLTALNVAAEGLQQLKRIRADLIVTVEAAEKADPLPDLDDAGLAKLFADIQAHTGD